jgi:hypothetical protein
MGKFLVVLGLVILVVALVPLTALGLVPGLSKLVGAGPRDLGIKITKEDSAAAISKMGTEIVPLPKKQTSTKDYVLEGTRDVDMTFSDKELTAHSNNRPWNKFPLKEVQIKITDDGTVESSGIMVVSKIIPYALALGYSEEEVKNAMEKYRIPPFEVPFYIKGTGSVVNNSVSLNASNIQIGAVPLPETMVSYASSQAVSLLDDLISRNSKSFSADEISFGKNTMHFTGRLPEKEFVTTE